MDDTPTETLTEQQLKDAILEAVNDGDSEDALHYAQRWQALQWKTVPQL